MIMSMVRELRPEEQVRMSIKEAGEKVEKYPNGKFTQAIRKKRIVKKPLEAAKKF